MIDLFGTSTSRGHILRSRTPNCAQEDSLEIEMMKIASGMFPMVERENILLRKLKHNPLLLKAGKLKIKFIK
jgi:hypothetical protein